MDRMRVCGTCDPGPIPGEGTKERSDFVLSRNVRGTFRPGIGKRVGDIF